VSRSLTAKKIARRYVQSLFAALDKKSDVEVAARDIRDIGNMIANSSEFRIFISSPLIGQDVQFRVIKTLAERAKLSKSVIGLLQILVKNRRLNILPSVVLETENYLAEQSGVVSVMVSTARPMDGADQKRIQTELKAVLGKDIIMQSFVDESLIGGLVVQMGSTLIDGSIKTKLDRLERKLVGSVTA